MKRMVMAALLLAGCGARREADPPPPQPAWNVRIDGVAPLMSADAAETALKAHGYHPIGCNDAAKPDPPAAGGGQPQHCFFAPGRSMMAILFYLDLPQGRLLAVATFYQRYSALRDDARAASNRAFAQTLRTQLGTPSLRSGGGSDFRTLYWFRPGGMPRLPDMISTTVGKPDGANVEMTSMWLYDWQRRAQAAAEDQRPSR